MDPVLFIENPNNDPIIARIIENYITLKNKKQSSDKGKIENKRGNTIQYKNSDAKSSD